MKTLLGLLFALVVLASPLFSQTAPPDLDAFTLIGRTETSVFLVDNKGVRRDRGNVTFDVLIAGRIPSPDGREALDPTNYIVLTIKSDCSKYNVTVLNQRGVLDGEAFNLPVKEPAVKMPGKGSPADAAVRLVCKTHVGTFV